MAGILAAGGDDYETPKLRGKAITSSDGGELDSGAGAPGHSPVLQENSSNELLLCG